MPLPIATKIKQSDFVFSDEEQAALSANAVRFCKFASDSDVRGYFKPCSDNYTPEQAKIEAGMSGYYRLALLNRAADVRLVYGEEGEVVGVFSVALEGAKPLSSKMEVYTVARLLKLNFMEIMWASFFREEEDMHPENVCDYAGTSDGYDFVCLEEILARWDFDASWFSKVVTLKGERHFGAGFNPELTAQKIKDFPLLPEKDGPCYWPSYNPRNGNPFPNKRYLSGVIQTLARKKGAVKQKYEAILKELLIDPDLIRQTMRDYMGGGALTNEMADHFIQRQRQLYQFMLVDRGFRYFLRDNHDVLKKIVEYMKHYNDVAGHVGLQVFDCQKAESRFSLLWRDISINNIQVTLESLTDILSNQTLVSVSKSGQKLVIDDDQSEGNTFHTASELSTAILNGELHRRFVIQLLKQYNALVDIIEQSQNSHQDKDSCAELLSDQLSALNQSARKSRAVFINSADILEGCIEQLQNLVSEFKGDYSEDIDVMTQSLMFVSHPMERELAALAPITEGGSDASDSESHLDDFEVVDSPSQGLNLQ